MRYSNVVFKKSMHYTEPHINPSRMKQKKCLEGNS